MAATNYEQVVKAARPAAFNPGVIQAVRLEGLGSSVRQAHSGARYTVALGNDAPLTVLR